MKTVETAREMENYPTWGRGSNHTCQRSCHRLVFGLSDDALVSGAREILLCASDPLLRSGQGCLAISVCETSGKLQTPAVTHEKREREKKNVCVQGKDEKD